MIPTLRAILVKVEVPENAKVGDKCIRTAQEINVNGSIADIHKVIGSSKFVIADVDKRHIAYIDDDGLNNDRGTGLIALTQTTWHPHVRLPGSFLIMGYPKAMGGCRSASISLAKLCETLKSSAVSKVGEYLPIRSCSYCGGSCDSVCDKLSHYNLTRNNYSGGMI